MKKKRKDARRTLARLVFHFTMVSVIYREVAFSTPPAFALPSSRGWLLHDLITQPWNVLRVCISKEITNFATVLMTRQLRSIGTLSTFIFVDGSSRALSRKRESSRCFVRNIENNAKNVRTDCVQDIFLNAFSFDSRIEKVESEMCPV